MPPTTKRRKRRKKHYHTGTHMSPKCLTPVNYRSGWELEVAKYLDKDPEVVSYEYESFFILYVSNIRTNRVRKYYPDFLVTYRDGTRKLIEVKRMDKIGDPTVMKKSAAARLWCEQHQTAPGNLQFTIWSNVIVDAIRKLNAVR